MNDTLKVDGSHPGDDLRMMQTPDLWPLGALLPLSRKHDDPIPGVEPFGDCAVMIASPGIPRLAVFVGVNIVFHRTLLPELIAGSREAAAQFKVLSYKDFEAIVDDGWRVG